MHAFWQMLEDKIALLVPRLGSELLHAAVHQALDRGDVVSPLGESSQNCRCVPEDISSPVQTHPVQSVKNVSLSQNIPLSLQRTHTRPPAPKLRTDLW